MKYCREGLDHKGCRWSLNDFPKNANNQSALVCPQCGCVVRPNNCDKNWISKKGSTCHKYASENLCKPNEGDGDRYGNGWKDNSTFEDDADIYDRTALVCPQCGCKETKHYWFFKKERTREGARADCEKRNMSLASLRSLEDLVDVANQMTGFKSDIKGVWLSGLLKANSTKENFMDNFFWATGDRIPYNSNYWRYNEPRPYQINKKTVKATILVVKKYYDHYDKRRDGSRGPLLATLASEAYYKRAYLCEKLED